jgi:hypothetical protein
MFNKLKIGKLYRCSDECVVYEKDLEFYEKFHKLSWEEKKEMEKTLRFYFMRKDEIFMLIKELKKEYCILYKNKIGFVDVKIKKNIEENDIV